jgi:hypothetical protein
MGAAKHNTIQLNGRHYDARTGKLLSAHETVTSGGASFVKPLAQQSGVALDGFKRSSGKTPAKHIHHKTEKSKTLMRHAVKKPAAPKRQAQPARVKRHAAPHLDIDPGRNSRAATISKSHMVSRFGTHHAPIKPVAAVVPVQPEPEAPPINPLGQHHEIFGSNLQPMSLEKAIQQATSHTHAKAKKASKRQKVAHKLRVSTKTANIAAASLATLLLVGFIAYQNVPNLAMRVATARAGVQGSLPGYQPSGFALSGPIQYRPGQITISYKSNSDNNRAFQVSQKTSEWNSETLREKYVASERRSYQTYQDGGRTIYIYEGNNATWVDSGVWYQIEGNSSLNSDQLLRIAASM